MPIMTDSSRESSRQPSEAGDSDSEDEEKTDQADFPKLWVVPVTESIADMAVSTVQSDFAASEQAWKDYETSGHWASDAAAWWGKQ